MSPLQNEKEKENPNKEHDPTQNTGERLDICLLYSYFIIYFFVGEAEMALLGGVLPVLPKMVIIVLLESGVRFNCIKLCNMKISNSIFQLQHG